MPPEPVDWQPAIVVLASGLVLGALVTLWLRRRPAPAAAAPEAPPLELRDLDGRVAALLVQLRELEDAASKRTPEQFARERYALELEAARALESREALAASLEAPASASAAPLPARGATHGFLWGAASSAAVALLVFFVSQSATQRQEGASPTGTGMGGTPRAAESEAAAGGEADDARTTELRQAVARNPDDFEARLELARELLGRHDLMGVWNETKYVLDRQPGHARALTYQSLVRLAMGQGELAVSMLKRAIASEPRLIEAHENLAFVYTSLGRTKEAEAAVAETVRLSPEDGERLRHALSQIKASRQNQAASPESADAHADIAPPGAEPPGAASAPQQPEPPRAAGAPAAGGAVFGWIEADASVAARITAASIIFVTVRPAGVSQGPPVAVKRLSGGRFPLQFEVSSQDSMMGQPLPESLRIDVRADSDGDPLTRPASDPAGFADGVAVGRTGVRITLK